jgi:hypothetical protein
MESSYCRRSLKVMPQRLQPLALVHAEGKGTRTFDPSGEVWGADRAI